MEGVCTAVYLYGRGVYLYGRGVYLYGELWGGGGGGRGRGTCPMETKHVLVCNARASTSIHTTRDKA